MPSQFFLLPAGPPAAPRRPSPRRGTALNPPNRFERLHLEPDPEAPPEEQPHPQTQFFFDATQSILSYNDSPDLPFSAGLNPYRGCEHGCAYCYARPYHDYLGWNAGLEFETKILVKLRAAELLRRELTSPRWKPQVVACSGVTDCYQPAERHFRLTRQCLEVFLEFRNPVGVITKNFLVTRDRDLLAELARWSCVAATLTLTTLDAELAGKLEPRAARPEHRLRAIRLLAEAGVPVGVNVAPIIPGLTDHEMPAILDAAAAAGATHAGYTILRLPYAVKDVFINWLETHAPTKKDRVLSRLRDLRGGELNVSTWGERFAGAGIFAEQISDLFEIAARRAGLNRRPRNLSTAHFRRPGGVQLSLF
ncbi:MAG TPA: PA0069 family radical SAM protein [Opitutaceae bacterium]|nr:PA0069 family radical SAM protein [Opitutaceae bacterium]